MQAGKLYSPVRQLWIKADVIMITDITTGFCGIRINKDTKEVFKELESNGYGVDIEIKARALEKGLIIEEIPIDTVYLNKVKGTTVFDGIELFIFIIRLKLALLFKRMKGNNK